MLVKKIMSKKPICLKPNDTLEKALKLMAKNNIGGCPVINDKKNVIGIVTQTDILRIIDVHSQINTSKDFLPLIFAVIKGEEYKIVKDALKEIIKMKIKKFMNKNVVTINEDDDVYTAARLMNSKDIERLPVVKKGKIVGMLTRKDLIKMLENLEEKKR